MKNRSYWEKRFTDLEKSLLNMSNEYCYENIERAFRLASADIEKEISAWYQRFADNNEMTLVNAKVALNRRELEELRWTIDDYIKRGKIPLGWERQLENASAKAHITRLEALKLKMQQSLEELYGAQRTDMDELLKRIYGEGHTHTAYEISKGVGAVVDYAGIDMNKIQSVVSKPWVNDGLTFSDRLWRDKEKLVSTLQTEMTRALIRGDKLADTVKTIEKKMNVGASQAARLVSTEAAFFAEKSRIDCFKELGVEKYEFIATLDTKTSPMCQKHDGKVYDIKDYKVGVNAPPLHCWCRSTIAPYFDDDTDKGIRVARDENGKRIEVKGDMKYEEWANEYLMPKQANKADKGQNTQSTQDKTRKVLDVTDVTQEYLSKAKPGEGEIAYSAGYTKSGHAEEIKIAEKLLALFGGKITLLSESNLHKQKTPDYLWSDKHWELKTLSTLNATGSAVRKGLKQIGENTGGLILDYQTKLFDSEEVQSKMAERLRRSVREAVDVIIFWENELKTIMRYKQQ